MNKKIGFLSMIFALLIVGCGKDPFHNSKDGTFKDSRDNHIYKWNRIGTQVYMAENLFDGVDRDNDAKSYGFSVRCLRSEQRNRCGFGCEVWV